MKIAVSDPPGRDAGADRGAHTRRGHRPRTPIEAFQALMQDPKLSDGAKRYAALVESATQSDDNAAFFMSSSKSAKELGWSKPRPATPPAMAPDGPKKKDPGIARVDRAQRGLVAAGLGVKMKARDYWRWQRAVGGPKLGLAPARCNGRPRYFFVARWKRPEAGPELWEIPSQLPECADLQLPDCADPGSAQMMTTESAPALPPSNVREFERGKGGTREGERNVTELALAEEKAPTQTPTAEAEYSEEQVKAWLAALNGRVESLRNVALDGLTAAGRVPPEWKQRAEERAAKFAAKLSSEAAETPRRAEEARPKSPAEQIEDRVRRLATPPGITDGPTIEELAFDLGHFLADAKSLAYHRILLREVATGVTPLDHYLNAFRKARKARRFEQGRAFAKEIQPYRNRGGKKNRPPALSCTRPPAVDPQKPLPTHTILR